jgi:hypothetical protein
MRFRLRTLLILLALLPPMLAWWGWPILDRIMHPPTQVKSLLRPVNGDFAFPIQIARPAPKPAP